MPDFAHATDWNAEPGERCPSTATLVLEGRAAGIIRCGCGVGHEGSHRHDFDVAWQDVGAPDWVEAHDPDEGFDVEVDALPHDDAIDARLAAESVGDDVAIEQSHAAIETTVRSRLDVILDEHRAAINGQHAALNAAALADLQRRYGDGPGRRGA